MVYDQQYLPGPLLMKDPAANRANPISQNSRQFLIWVVYGGLLVLNMDPALPLATSTCQISPVQAEVRSARVSIEFIM